MGLIDEKQELERLDQFIRLQATGTPDELAEKMQVSTRTIFRTINRLKEMGCPIYFNKSKNSYCYQYNGKLEIKYGFNLLDNEELSRITGGNGYNFFHTDTFCQSAVVPLHCETEMFYRSNWLMPAIKI